MANVLNFRELMTYFYIILLVALSGLFSGLNLGLLSLNVTLLENKAKAGDEDAKKLLPIRKKGNLLLCTLLLGNVAVNATISIFLSSVTAGLIAGIISTSLIVIFGEIIPQAFVSRYALLVGARTAWMTRIFIIILYPIAAPLGFILDKVLGAELPTIWNKEELKEIIKVHEDSPESEIDEDEERILLGTLTFSQKKVKDIMTPRTVMFSIKLSEVLKQDDLNEIKEEAYSRIPVYKENIDNIVGVLYSNDLIGLQAPIKIKDVYETNKVLKVNENTKLDDILDTFIKERNHLAFIYNEFGGLDGIVTLEDVIEEILQKEVYDEDDEELDLRTIAKRKAQKHWR